MSDLLLVEKRLINNVIVDGFYRDEQALFNRFQIGSALEYTDPAIAIAKIHKRHKERLDQFSFLYQSGKGVSKQKDGRMTVSECCKDLGISRSTWYERVRKVG